MTAPTIVFAHGAGASSRSAWMRAWAARLRRIADVVTFDYPYMRAGRRAPDRLPKLIAAHRDEVARARSRSPRLVLAGKSMGSRVACHVAAVEPVHAVVCFGYPLRAAGKSGALRDAALLECTAPVLFVQGTRDPLCPLDQLELVRSRMQVQSELYVVPEGDHSLQVTQRWLKQSGTSQRDVDERVFEQIARFLQS